MSRMKFAQRLCVAVAASVLVTSCGAGTESGVSNDNSDGRNVALPGQDGLPFQGISNNVKSVAVNPSGRGAWVGGELLTTGQVTGGAMVLQAPDYSTLDPTFPRIDGRIDAAVHDPITNEFAVAGYFSLSRPNAGQDVMIFTPDGTRALRGALDGQITSMAILGRTLFTAGTSRSVEDFVGNRTLEIFGLHRFDMGTGLVLPQAQLAGLGPGVYIQDITVGRFSTNRSLAIAAVIIDSSRARPYSLKIFNAQNGVLVKTLATDKQYIQMKTVENGYAIVEMPGEPTWLLEVDTGQYIANYRAPNFETGFWAGDGRIRVLKVDIATGAKRLVNLNKRTLAEVDSIELPAETELGNLFWAGPDATLIGGVLFKHQSRSFVRLVRGSPWALEAISVGPRGLFVGGSFRTFGDTKDFGALRIPDDLTLDSVTGFEPTSVESVQAMATTPKGVIAVVDKKKVVLFDKDPSVPPTEIASFTRLDCILFHDYDIEWTGTSVMVAGCWDDIRVGNSISVDKVVEIDLSGPSPIMGRTYSTGANFPDQVTATDQFVYVTTVLQQDVMSIYARVPRVVVATRTYNSRLEDIVALTGSNNGGDVPTHDIVVAVGNNLQEKNRGDGGAIVVHTVPRNNPQALTIRTYNNYRGPGLSAALVDTRAQGGSDYAVYVGGSFVDVNGTRRGVLRWGVKSDQVTALEFGMEREIEDIAIDGHRLWFVGGFADVLGRQGWYRASGVGVFNLSTNELMLRGSGAAPTTTTTAPPVDPGATGAVVDPGAPAGGQDDPLSGPPVGPTPPPTLPTTGEAAPGLYTSVTASGMRTEVKVDDDGTITITPEVGSTPVGRPYIVKLKPGSRNIRVSWRSTTSKATYKVTTGRGKARRTCTTTRTWCTVKNLDPWKAHTFTVEATTGRRKALSDASPRIKPHVKVKKSSSTKASTIAPQGAKGKAAWTTSAPCTVKAGRLIAPKKAARCVLTVKAGKSTRKVTVVVG